MGLKDKYNVAVVGATGLVGETILDILEEREFPVGNLVPLASNRSLGKTVHYCESEYAVVDLETFDFTDIDIAFFSAGANVSRVYAVKAASQGAVVIDNTSEFRMQDDIPLIVPECNLQDLDRYKLRNIIANPNCSTIQMLVALKPLHDAFDIERINVATYQATSGAGRSFMQSLETGTKDILSGSLIDKGEGEHPIPFNVIPKIDVLQPNGYTKEEMKIVLETKKVLNSDTINVNPTCVRVPVFFGHSEAVHIETFKEPNIDEVIQILSDAPGILVVNGKEPGDYPSAVYDAAGRDEVFVGRIRKDISTKNGLNLWVVSDNIRKGAALNSIQIGECLIEQYL